MKSSRLTTSHLPATRQWTGGTIAVAVLVACLMMLPGCISISAPDKPIVIELNINIKQEVIYRLAEDVKQNIEANPDIF